MILWGWWRRLRGRRRDKAGFGAGFFPAAEATFVHRADEEAGDVKERDGAEHDGGGDPVDDPSRAK